MAIRRGVQPVDGLHRDVHRGVEAERVVGGAQVIVDGLGHADHLHPLLVQPGGDTQSVLPADRDQRIHAQAGQVVLDPVQAGPASGRGALAQGVGARRAEDGAAAGQDAAHRRHVQRHGVALQRAAPAIAESGELIPVLRHSGAHDRPDDRVQAWAVTAAGQDSDSHGSSSRVGFGGLPTATLVPMSVLSIAAGTTGVTALVISPDGSVAGRGYQEFRQFYPHPGWVEHLPEGIWQATLAACGQALDGAEPPTCVGITNQRETAVIWDRATLAAPRWAIVWQDRRTADICARLREQGHESRVAALTGLRLDPYFTATKLTWLGEDE